MAFRAKRMPESAIQSQIVQLLRTVRGAVWTVGTHRRRDDYQGTMQSPGIPDLMAFVPVKGVPVLLFVECKAAGGRLRLEQEVFRAQCVAAGVAHVVGGFDDVVAWLIARGVLTPEQVPHYRQPKESHP